MSRGIAKGGENSTNKKFIFGRKNINYTGSIPANKENTAKGDIDSVKSDNSKISQIDNDSWNSELIYSINSRNYKENLYFEPLDIYDVMNENLLKYHLNNGNIKASRNDETGLTVLKYTEQLSYKRIWDEATLQSRGLIIDDDGEIIARGFNKFFNKEELENIYDIKVNYDKPVTVMPKLDGALGIAFKHDDQWVVSMGGSLNSKLSEDATALFNEKYKDTPYKDGKTIVLEIINPQTKVVTDYGDENDLHLIGATDRKGAWISPDDIQWSGPRVETRRLTLNDLIKEGDPKDGSEGYVIMQDDGLMYKMKHESYKTLHKSRYVVNDKSVYEAVSEGKFDEFAETIPEEFRPELEKIREKLNTKIENITREAEVWSERVPKSSDREERYQWIKKNVPNHYRKLVIDKELNQLDITESIFKMARPGAMKKKHNRNKRRRKR